MVKNDKTLKEQIVFKRINIDEVKDRDSICLFSYDNPEKISGVYTAKVKRTILHNHLKYVTTEENPNYSWDEGKFWVLRLKKDEHNS